ncbi:uncharacterized protein TRUGW13939_00991 [Talaromyces rugulosus]|uniref:BZIP domain-containing protein n=1 Tax=Talaromyces rugulosus TaxID=121627 RepID=A0A7H8QK49_TALRU|nr:uncharacterized protein TRUGW13939_00991 [Talaromyces rugulosus]QKX53911.1 hypothetical protein TRUGW13939_00991 [Talaromyces rugulosus]
MPVLTVLAAASQCIRYLTILHYTPPEYRYSPFPMTAILTSLGSTSCSYLDTKTSNHIFCTGSGCEYAVDNCLANDMSAASTDPRPGWRATHNSQSPRPRDPSTSAPTTSNFISTSWSEGPSHLDPALAHSMSFDFDQIILPDSNLIDLGVSLGDFMPRITEPRSLPSTEAASGNLIGRQPHGYTLENKANRHPSQSPSLLYQTLSGPPSQQHTHSPKPIRNFQTINKQQQQHLRQNTTVAESTCSDTPSSQDSGDDPLTEKRRRNKLAAQRLRQKKLDRISGLESRLEEITKERDDLRLRLAKWEGEAMAMRQLFDQKMKE